ncbi:Hsp90 cochaperone [Maudiozyma exigua]|uniref:Hsp90 cochaperone n=1 Tax=Maudiozyma exigua TaxID=34358 RepID=A0A9P7BCC5_MAUEX|nr:Hsp90 cochaperone [Kazachstania exigua]
MSLSADEYKQQGNTAFSSKEYEKAIDLFTKAIEVSETPNHVLYSNRSATYASMKKFGEALKDADECTKINPTWSKGYNRKGAAHFGLGDLDEAETAYKKALELDANNKAAQDGLDQVRRTQESRQAQPDLGLSKLFADPNLIENLKKNPKTTELMKDPTLVAKLIGYKANPQSIVDEEDKDKAEADKAKAEGNKAYKAHNFDEAIAQYNKAWDLYKDITYLNNRSAAEFEKGDYETAINTLTEAVEQGRDLRADYKIIAKSFARMGNSYYKLNDLNKAIEFYQKSLTEHRTADILTKLRNTEKELKTKEAEEYINPEKAEEARLEGKEYFTKGDWPKAVEAYTEMIKRAPEDARGYSNRAAALAKLMSFPSAIEDCDKAIQKDPNFIRAYIRKATAQIAVKEFSSALETLDIARTKDAETNNGTSAKEIDQLYYKASAQRFQPAEGNETPEQVYQRAMKDPEVQRIMQDPVIQSILSQAQSDPAALQEHMKNPEVFKKIQTLIAAGIIQTGRR